MDITVNKQDLTVEQKAVLLSVGLLDSKNTFNRVYFEKFLFLLTKSLPDILESLNDTFEAYKLGPYNEYADEVIDGLQDYSLMTSWKDLSEEGQEMVRELSQDKESQPIIGKIHELNYTLSGLNVDDLLYLTYNLYPDYASQSAIAGRVGSDKLETFKLSINHLKEGQISSIKSDKGNDIRVKKEGSRLVIMGD